LRKRGNVEDKMQTAENTKRSKGGRPKKAIKQKEFIGIKCSMLEKTYLVTKAKAAGLSLSEFIREGALKGQAVRQIRLIPKEILQFTATLNHLAANINQIAKKCNQNYDLDEAEKASLNTLSTDIKQLAQTIKNQFV
jgi:hypothetical protein